MKKLKGEVLWFNPKLGYGFISNSKIKRDIFVHYSDINYDGYKELFQQDKVKFVFDKDKNKALEVIVIEKSNKRLLYNK